MGGLFGGQPDMSGYEQMFSSPYYAMPSVSALYGAQGLLKPGGMGGGEINYVGSPESNMASIPGASQLLRNPNQNASPVSLW